MCVAGGKRCEYSDAISNVRKKTRNKYRNEGHYTLNDKIDEAVTAFKNSNPELVKAHMPEKQKFQYTPPAWEVPSSLLEKLGNKRSPVKGFETPEELDQMTKNLYERRQKWKESLTENEDWDVSSYAMNAYESMNPYLRKSGYAEWCRKNGHLTAPAHDDPEKRSYADRMVKPRIAGLDAALEKAPKSEQPEKLYRYYQVPDGITPEEYAEKYFPAGGGFKDAAYMSTSADPEFVTSLIMSESEKNKNKKYIVLEILSKSGASMQAYETREHGRIQALEAEVLLPRNQGMRIIDAGKKTLTFGQHRPDLERQYTKPSKNAYPEFNEKKKISVPVIRMIDEDLIRETRKTEKK